MGLDAAMGSWLANWWSHRSRGIHSCCTKRSPALLVDRKRLFFYEVLGNAKMSVICLSGIREFAEGRSFDPSMVLLTQDGAADLARRSRGATEAGLGTMRPTPKEILAGMLARISETMVPELKSPFAISQAAAAAKVLSAASRMDRSISETHRRRDRGLEADLRCDPPAWRVGDPGGRRISGGRSMAACAHPTRNRPIYNAWRSAMGELAGGVATGAHRRAGRGRSARLHQASSGSSSRAVRAILLRLTFDVRRRRFWKFPSLAASPGEGVSLP